MGTVVVGAADFIRAFLADFFRNRNDGIRHVDLSDLSGDLYAAIVLVVVIQTGCQGKTFIAADANLSVVYVDFIPVQITWGVIEDKFEPVDNCSPTVRATTPRTCSSVSSSVTLFA